MAGRILSARRALVCVAVGAVAGAVAAVAVAPRLGPLVAWCTAGLIALLWVWRICWPQDPGGTERLAREESSSRVTDDAIIAACLASIAAVVVALIQSSDQGGDAISVALVILGVLGTMVAWASPTSPSPSACPSRSPRSNPPAATPGAKLSRTPCSPTCSGRS